MDEACQSDGVDWTQAREMLQKLREKVSARMSDNPCQMTVEPFKQCCCTCESHLPTHEHCTTSKLKSKDGCACNIQNGWACVPPGEGKVYINWPEHSCGCELYTPRKA